jgi:hypothetical protein
MPKYQAYNNRINAWVKYEFTSSGIAWKDVKQRQPKKPFKNVKIKGNQP